MSIEQAKSIVILGRQPALGIAELESLYGSENVLPYGEHIDTTKACLLSIDPTLVDFKRLGGSIKLGRIITTLPATNWRSIETYLLESTPKHAADITGKLKFGLSTYGLDISAKSVASTAMAIKKVIKNSGGSVRMVPHKDLALGSATVLHNRLTGKNGWELLIVSDGKTAFLAQTVNVQDIDAYASRDQARPMRDPKVGMLPPKLAQILVNLATQDADPKQGLVVLDPFCGTGVLLQEALLAGFAVHGSDIDQRMIEYSRTNLEWLTQRWDITPVISKLEVADATTHTWAPPPTHIAAETFLGKPLSTLPPSDQLSKIIYEANITNHRFLQNISGQLKSGSRLALGVPAWKGKHEFLHLPLLDHLTDMGYTRLRFKHALNDDLIYHRDSQVVARELLVLVKN